jgi:methylthioribose-1-phosphate isomerase
LPILFNWELGHQGAPHAIIADNIGGHLMQYGLVDIVITGAPTAPRRKATSATKTGIYLKDRGCDGSAR